MAEAAPQAARPRSGAAGCEAQAGGRTPPEERGTLTIRNRVVTRIACAAAGEVAGVSPGSADTGRRSGGGMPRAIAAVRNGSAVVGIRIAVHRAESLPDVTRAVQQRVTERIRELTALVPIRVDVTVGRLSAASGAGAAHTRPSEPSGSGGRSGGAMTGRRVSAREPRAAPASAAVFVVIGFALFAIGALCVREALLYYEVIAGDPWLANTVAWVARLTWRDWMRYAAPACVAIGIALLWSALRPRRRTHLRLHADVPVWLTPTNVARACSARAKDALPHCRVATIASRRKITVTVSMPSEMRAEAESASADQKTPMPDLERSVRDAVLPLVGDLTPRPRVNVRTALLPDGPRQRVR
ncbi:Asp23/Gls24 family envelope stress response protein [Tomitella cavernea]|uniref:Asp23/Gls24 family envelope stress response protein n=1 Tax=Tomitella cavernea TaxID=1387982 RepID=A0ABP9C9Z4_9ACTN|nr:Asp23/Gls24 family envelope stress response protein [Tomitella cavernea]